MKKNHDFKLFSSYCVIMMLLNYIMMKVVKDHCIKLDLTYINYVQLHIQLWLWLEIKGAYATTTTTATRTSQICIFDSKKQ